MSGKVYGYVRVSTKQQREDRQVIAMREYGIAEKNIVVEKLSGKNFERPAYCRLIKRLRPGDTLVIKSVDRLGRNYEEVLAQWRYIHQEKQVAIVVLDLPLLNTVENQELIWRLLNDLVLQIFSYVAENERANIRQRQKEGIAAAKARGVRFGRPRCEMPENFSELTALWRHGDISARAAARALHVSPHTFLRRLRELGVERAA